MPKLRTIFNTSDLVTGLSWTEVISDQNFQSSWANPNVPLLIFSDWGSAQTR